MNAKKKNFFFCSLSGARDFQTACFSSYVLNTVNFMNSRYIRRIMHYPMFLVYVCGLVTINTLRPRQNGCHFSKELFTYIFLTENVWISIRISLKFVPKVPIDNKPALVQIMIWHWTGEKPLSNYQTNDGPISLMHVCVTLPQWVIWPLYLSLGQSHNYDYLIWSNGCAWIY